MDRAAAVPNQLPDVVALARIGCSGECAASCPPRGGSRSHSVGGGGLSPGPSSVLPTGRGWSPRQKGVWSEATAVEAGVRGRACPLWEGAGKGLLTHMHQAVLGGLGASEEEVRRPGWTGPCGGAGSAWG